ncbi:MAG TPA: DUF4149 domain-containing protein [Labilithrix sp.]|jgi:hypothetical protein
MSTRQGSRGEIAIIVSVELLAMMVWGGGLIVLGAVAAPLVFGIVPAPHSADAMTQVFLRFDRVAMTCAAIALVAESALGRRAGKIARLDLARLGIVVLAGALTIAQGAWLSPKIAELHRGGAVRGLGEAGLALERFHGWSETSGKTELALLIAAVVLVVWKACTLQNEPVRH